MSGRGTRRKRRQKSAEASFTDTDFRRAAHAWLQPPAFVVVAPKSPPRPFYCRGGVTLYCGEARDILPTLTEKGLVVTDPPYSEEVHAKPRAGARTKPLLDGNGRLSRCAMFRQEGFGFEHLTDEDRRMFAEHFARLAKRWVLAFSDLDSSHQWKKELTGHGLEFIGTMIWHKVCGTPAFCGDRFAKGCEAIVVARETTSCEAIVVAHPYPPGRKHWNGGGKHGFYEHQIVIGQVEPRYHPTQKPLPLMLELVNDFSDPGELIYDACMGSGTTAVACLRGHGGPRRFIGIEREKQWAEVAAERIDAEITGTTVVAQRAGQLAMFGDTG